MSREFSEDELRDLAADPAFDAAWDAPDNTWDAARERITRAARQLAETEGPDAIFYPAIGTVNGVVQPTREQFLQDLGVK